ncbi:MAG: asparagine synthase (glutamine-hydrolyzing) [Holosporaceae bacterium]|jgi:asparagine synthase (glutamine-hydrolysing)
MCGIGGIYLNDKGQLPLRQHLEKMLDIQHHRGPDGRGLWLNDSQRLGLCHNRLAILDLSDNGRQPMHSADGRYTIVFNGEIYNYRDVRQSLAQLGANFSTQTDTEVLIAAYQQWGDAMLDKLRGMFALAIYDSETKTLFCARDRVGKKPFVYAQTHAAFIFASEIPAVKQVPGVDDGYDHAAIAGMLLHNLRHIPDPHTAYRGIKRLRPGHAMIVQDGQVQRIWRYWTPTPDRGVITPTRLRDLLNDAVRLRMQADVPVGALLSGGVDSSAIVALMQQQSATPIHTYALGFNAEDEDLRRARIMADKLGCRHREFYFDPTRQWEIFCKLIHTYGEPIMLLPLIHAYELSAAIRDDGIKVVLGGHGADEIFYGYTGHVRTARLSALMPWLSPFARLGSAALGGINPSALSMLSAKAGHRKAAFYRHCAAQHWSTILSPDIQAGLDNVVAEELTFWGGLCPSKKFIDESNFVALMVENTHSLTISSDLPAMLASVEMRAPFLDQRIIAFAMATPLSQKVPWIAPKNRLKWILRQAVRDLIPEELLFAPKRGFGFGIPQDEVLRGPWRNHGDVLFANPHDAGGLFEKNALREAWNQFKTNGSGGVNVIPKMLAVQYWLQSQGSVI